MTDRIRVLRVLEYEGPREWVEKSLAQRSVKGEKRIEYSLPQRVNAVIRESIIGETPVVLQVKKPSPLYYVSGIPGEAPILIDEPKPCCRFPSYTRCIWPECRSLSGKCGVAEKCVRMV